MSSKFLEQRQRKLWLSSLSPALLSLTLLAQVSCAAIAANFAGATRSVSEIEAASRDDLSDVLICDNETEKKVLPTLKVPLEARTIAGFVPKDWVLLETSIRNGDLNHDGIDDFAFLIGTDEGVLAPDGEQNADGEAVAIVIFGTPTHDYKRVCMSSAIMNDQVNDSLRGLQISQGKLHAYQSNAHTCGLQDMDITFQWNGTAFACKKFHYLYGQCGGCDSEHYPDGIGSTEDFDSTTARWHHARATGVGVPDDFKPTVFARYTLPFKRTLPDLASWSWSNSTVQTLMTGRSPAQEKRDRIWLRKARKK